MRSLADKLLTSTFEAFGIVFPGVIFIAMVVGLLANTLAALGAWSSISPLFTWLGTAGKDLSSGLAALVVTYVCGQLLKATAREWKEFDDKTSEPKRPMWIDILLLSGRRLPKGPKGEYRELLMGVIEQMPYAEGLRGQDDTPKNAWKTAFPCLRAYHAQVVGRGLYDTFQEKFTFYRSVATAAAIVIWLNLLALAIAVVYSANVDGDLSRLQVLWLLGPQLVLWPILIGFTKSHAYFWELYSDSLIAEFYAAWIRKAERP